ncbi:hypothetical protein EDEG_03829 [Edhazardia aedis USNM 41457]|uniref:Uncharacterized protein n=1 Tax=Edhazardia aedis (strain USNM 41457) TaxID=1003232 RepID=J9D1C0_EDHAE|nr:hypothetical protein EDEG_03829 [Edhazardia aedis USNM 41457]|eukprot:EJW01626.1 hypothetical protein EDEG_03829 [Edhazardia aedis USNM 41457]
MKDVNLYNKVGIVEINELNDKDDSYNAGECFKNKSHTDSTKNNINKNTINGDTLNINQQIESFNANELPANCGSTNESKLSFDDIKKGDILRNKKLCVETDAMKNSTNDEEKIEKSRCKESSYKMFIKNNNSEAFKGFDSLPMEYEKIDKKRMCIDLSLLEKSNLDIDQNNFKINSTATESMVNDKEINNSDMSNEQQCSDKNEQINSGENILLINIKCENGIENELDGEKKIYGSKLYKDNLYKQSSGHEVKNRNDAQIIEERDGYHLNICDKIKNMDSSDEESFNNIEEITISKNEEIFNKIDKGNIIIEDANILNEEVEKLIIEESNESDENNKIIKKEFIIDDKNKETILLDNKTNTEEKFRN